MICRLAACLFIDMSVRMQAARSAVNKLSKHKQASKQASKQTNKQTNKEANKKDKEKGHKKKKITNK